MTPRPAHYFWYTASIQHITFGIQQAYNTSWGTDHTNTLLLVYSKHTTHYLRYTASIQHITGHITAGTNALLLAYSKHTSHQCRHSEKLTVNQENCITEHSLEQCITFGIKKAYNTSQGTARTNALLVVYSKHTTHHRAQPGPTHYFRYTASIQHITGHSPDQCITFGIQQAYITSMSTQREAYCQSGKRHHRAQPGAMHYLWYKESIQHITGHSPDQCITFGIQ